MRKQRPRPLRAGDCVAVVAPSGAVRPRRLERGLAALRRLGLKVLEAPHLYDRWGYLAGRDRDRAADLQEMFARPDVQGIFCARGGYGAGRILPHLNLAQIRRHPKVFLGSSDVTILHLALTQRVGLVTFHGPMVEPDLARRNNPLTRQSLRALVVRGEAFAGRIRGRFLGRPGRIAGELTGGNLTLVAFSLGTPYAIDTAGKVLFLEEVNEEPYRIDRLLTQLKLAGKLTRITGIVFGEMVGCRARRYLRGFSAAAVLTRFAEEANVPCFATFPSGHGRENVVLPMGGRIVLEPEGRHAARFRLTA